MLGAWVLILIISSGSYVTSPNSMTTAYFATQEHCRVAQQDFLKAVKQTTSRESGLAAMCFHTGAK